MNKEDFSRTLAPVSAPPAPAQLWGVGGVAWLAVSLAAFFVGAFPEWIAPSHVADRIASPPVLPAVIAVQAGFILLFGPILAAGRPVTCPGAFLLTAFLRHLVALAAAAPLYLAAAWLSDARPADVVRALLYLTAVAGGAAGLALWAARRGPALSAVALVGVLAALGGPAACYLIAELTDLAGRAGWLWLACPTTCSLTVAAARGAAWYPTPLWSWLLWPAVGAAATLAFLLLAPAKRRA